MGDRFRSYPPTFLERRKMRRLVFLIILLSFFVPIVSFAGQEVSTEVIFRTPDGEFSILITKSKSKTTLTYSTKSGNLTVNISKKDSGNYIDATATNNGKIEEAWTQTESPEMREARHRMEILSLQLQAGKRKSVVSEFGKAALDYLELLVAERDKQLDI